MHLKNTFPNKWLKDVLHAVLVTWFSESAKTKTSLKWYLLFTIIINLMIGAHVYLKKMKKMYLLTTKATPQPFLWEMALMGTLLPTLVGWSALGRVSELIRTLVTQKIWHALWVIGAHCVFLFALNFKKSRVSTLLNIRNYLISAMLLMWYATRKSKNVATSFGYIWRSLIQSS